MRLFFKFSDQWYQAHMPYNIYRCELLLRTYHIRGDITIMLVNHISPNVSAAEYSLIREEVGTSIYDIVKKYLNLPASDDETITQTVQHSRCQAGNQQE